MDLLVVAVIVIGFLALAAYLNHKLGNLQKNQTPPELLEVVKLLQQSSQEDRRTLMQSLRDNTQDLNRRLDSTARVIADVHKSVGEMSEIGRSMKDLQQFLQSPKLRGNMGEHVLGQLLVQMLPKKSFHLQYTFRSGEKVDAAIQTSGGIIPVDSKFPMENFRRMSAAQKEAEKGLLEKQFVRDVKLHIDAIARKYIATDEGTIDYALMYIPSEAVYYEVANNPKLFEYAGDKRVLPVSPTTFYAYLRAILMSMEGQKIETHAREMLANIRAMQKDYEKVNDNLSTLSRHMTNAQNMLSALHDSFRQLGGRLAATKRLEEKEDSDL